MRDLAQVTSVGSALTSAEPIVCTGLLMDKTRNRYVTFNSAEHVFGHICNRRAGIVKALTCDFDKFFEECDPEKDNLCLYGLGSGKWVVGLPEDKVPPEIPEPTLGINFVRDQMPRKNWLKFIAIHSDAWLLGLAAFYGGLLHSSRRKELFCMLCDMPTIYDIVSGKADPISSTSTPSTGGISVST